MTTKRNPVTKVVDFREKSLSDLCNRYRKNIIKYINSVDDLFGANLINTQVGRAVDNLAGEIRGLIFLSVEESIDATLDHYGANKAQIEDVKRRTLIEFSIGFFKDASFDTRVSKIKQRIRQLIDADLQQSISQGRQLKDVAELIGNRIISESPIKGGSLYGGFSTLLVSECYIAYHYATIAIFRRKNIGYARFTLTQDHSGEDVCNTLSKVVNIDISKRVHILGITPEGIYKLDDFPSYPHPRACYYIEPIDL